ncbi:glycosyltransferase family 39 protein [Sphingopyxis sp. JAI128]|uniref:ArnT family glycosyltransferase n=1 Tax=Sphingopyxis sp. JAI128 TaxID=2723066 RepID=UPI00160FC85C|nr:glycosyltransferase family 39 protein [Sphingopyxis sp. JAI128]MBB6427284.1 4-amino-4-deoxy-L-arabinose transferase-like glycosyltransferase [Sphingopyxis sp. JAI128]
MPTARNSPWKVLTGPAGLCLILFVAALLRIDGVGFGLPALNDADEPLFMATAVEMLSKPTLNPGWFGHPGTVTFYSLMLVVLLVGGLGILTGRFADFDTFAASVYTDPGIVFLPARLMMVAFGVACVWMTWRLGKQLGGNRIGLVAAAILAVNAVHIEYSQIIRTDVQASLFMLLCAQSALAIAQDGRRRDYLFAGFFAGLACATKWPGAVVGVTLIGACLCRWRSGVAEWRDFVFSGLAAAATLFVVSPFLLIDHATVLQNLSGEARPLHPGATGGGLFDNLGWYIAGPLFSSLGIGGLLLVGGGLVWGAGDRHRWAWVILPFCLTFLCLIAIQSLRWERWIVPLLPFAALAAARALCAMADWLPAPRARVALPVALGLLLIPMVVTERLEAAGRRQDTRQAASAWLRDHAPRGSRILIENPAFDLLDEPWQLLYPMGSAGCVDVHDMLAGRIGQSEVEDRRQGGAIVDVGHVDMARLDSCRADFAVVTNHIRYRADRVHFREALRRYDRLLAGGRLRLVVRPEPGISSGPEVHIVELARPPAAPAVRRAAGYD